MVCRMKNVEKKDSSAKESSRLESQEVRTPCDLCGKVFNKKSMSRHMREIHPQLQAKNGAIRKSSVLSIVNDLDKEKRKADVISPPSAQPEPKKELLQLPNSKSDAHIDIQGANSNPGSNHTKNIGDISPLLKKQGDA